MNPDEDTTMPKAKKGAAHTGRIAGVAKGGDHKKPSSKKVAMKIPKAKTK